VGPATDPRRRPTTNCVPQELDAAHDRDEQPGRRHRDSGQPADRRHRSHVSTLQNPRGQADPSFNDLRQELETWRDESEVERIRDEAQLAAVKLREWTGDKVYARLFDRPTTGPNGRKLAVL